VRRSNVLSYIIRESMEALRAIISLEHHVVGDGFKVI
jgi:hypothetical protein